MPELLFEVRPAPTMSMFETVMPAVLYAATHDDWEWPGPPIGRVERERTGERLTTREVHTIARAERRLVDARERPPRRRRRGARGRIAARSVQVVIGCGRAAGDAYCEPHEQKQLRESDELAQFDLWFRRSLRQRPLG